MSSEFNCFLSQKNAIKSMIELHQVENPEDNLLPKEPNWKVLLYDSIGANIIFLLFTVKELRNLGVTLLLPITHNDRTQIPETNVIYFICDTKENIDLIGDDMRKNLYDVYYIYFVDNNSIDHMELLASYSLQYGTSMKISMVYDEYVNYLSLENNYFITTSQMTNNHLLTINNPATSEQTMEALCDSMVESLLSVLITLNTIPIIRSQKNNAAEMVAMKLNQRIRDILKDGKSLFSWNPSRVKSSSTVNYQRPLLVIIDRSIDVATPLRHSWTYQALLHDLYSIEMNQVKVAESESTNKTIKKYHLSPSDKFWENHRNDTFPNIADAMQDEINDYKNAESQLTGFKSNMNSSLANTTTSSVYDDVVQQNTQKLSSAINCLPELINRKKFVDMHTTLASHLLDVIKDRKLDKFYEMEQKVVTDMITDQNIISFLSEKNGTIFDRQRCLLIKLLTCSDEDYNTIGDLIKSSTSLLEDDYDGCITFVDKWKKINKLISGNDMIPYSSHSNNKEVSSFSSHSLQQGATHYSQLISKYIPSSSKKLVKGVKNLMLGSKALPLTNVVSSLMDPKQNNDNTNFTYFDPKMISSHNFSTSDNKKTSFNYAIVFVVGGGCYFEYLDLLDEVENKSSLSDPKKIIYGCSEQLNPDNFLRQLVKLSAVV